MAKSPVGGSRAYLKGRIGSDVYTLGKDGKGKRQQVVRSLAEEVSNPRTSSQMFGRMIMTTIAQAAKALNPIIDHSFDGVAIGQPSISTFTKANYALAKADAVAHPASGNTFGLKKYQEKGISVGAYVISKGKATLPAAVSLGTKVLNIALTAATLTVGGLKAALGLTASGYLTIVVVSAGKAEFVRVKLATDLADSTAISAGNVASLFSYEGNVAAVASLSTNTIVITPTLTASTVFAQGVIVSDKKNSGWIHSACTLAVTGTPDYNANTALPTYPTGTAQFLNGGEL